MFSNDLATWKYKNPKPKITLIPTVEKPGYDFINLNVLLKLATFLTVLIISNEIPPIMPSTMMLYAVKCSLVADNDDMIC